MFFVLLLEIRVELILEHCLNLIGSVCWFSVGESAITGGGVSLLLVVLVLGEVCAEEFPRLVVRFLFAPFCGMASQKVRCVGCCHIPA